MVGRVKSMVLTALWRRLIATVRLTDGRVLARSTRRALLRTGDDVRPAPLRVRQLLEACQPVDPLGTTTEALPTIDLVAACHPRDAALIGITLSAAARASRNPVRTIWVAVPDGHEQAIAQHLDGVRVVSESSVIGDDLRRRIVDRFPAERVGWVVQQVLKVLLTLRSPETACLVVDADTVLLRPRTWLTRDGVQVLSPSWEFHRPYDRHTRSMWPEGPAATRVSFVTHHQLMQRDVLATMFGADGEGLTRWIDLADVDAPSAVSEYHSYGAFLTSHHPDRVAPAQWHNRWVPRSQFAAYSADPVRSSATEHAAGANACSLSFHHWT